MTLEEYSQYLDALTEKAKQENRTEERIAKKAIKPVLIPKTYKKKRK